LNGYRDGLNKPVPFVLDENWGWLLKLSQYDDDARTKFWSDIDKGKRTTPPPDVQKYLLAALPEQGLTHHFASRRAGGGSLGRPRYVVVASWLGGRVVREAKALVPSAWNWAHGQSEAEPQFMKLAKAAGRASDPYLRECGNFIIRRLAPDSRKHELSDDDRPQLEARLLAIMGREIGALHALGQGAADTIRSDLESRPDNWLLEAATETAAAVRDDKNECALLNYIASICNLILYKGLTVMSEGCRPEFNLQNRPGDARNG
jgi:hypothetical protein